jgi:hypothetical protein
MTSLRCPRRWCGELAVPDTDGNGKAVLVCQACDRNARGRCRDCPKRLPNSHCRRCGGCAKARKRGISNRRRREKYADDVHYRARVRRAARRLNARKRVAYQLRYRTDAAFRAIEKKRCQRSYQRCRERILTAKRLAYRVNADAQRARCKAYREAHREEIRQYLRDYYRLKDRKRRAERRRKAVCKVCSGPMPQRMKIGAIRRVCEACRPLKYVRYRDRKRQRELERAA